VNVPYVKPRGFFVAGTDTGVGKTALTIAMIRALVRQGLRVAAMKPVAAGAVQTPDGLRNDDAVELARAANVQIEYARVNPVCLPLPASPHIAAEKAGIRIDLASIMRTYDDIAQTADLDVVAVEGAGGWLAPISETETMADLAKALGLPVILVVGMRLGCLNHALLTAGAIQSAGLRLAGWIANHIDPEFAHAAENVATLDQRLPAPRLESVAFDAFPQAFTSVTAVTQLQAALAAG
jgi:dethiobiotin synthetase